MPVETARKILHDFLRHAEELKEIRRPPTDGEDDDDDVHDGFEEEFLRVKDESTSFGNEGVYAALAGKLEYNRKKNRYKDILPYDISRVKLSEVEGVNGSDYINASFIKGVTYPREYIAAQAPLPHTLNDFWRMIIEQKIVVIVMAANEIEGNKVKCERYWPEVGQEKAFGDISVTMVSEEWHNDYFVERLMCAKWQTPVQKSASGAGTASRSLHQQTICERSIVQYHYVAWPDHGIPPSNASIPHLVDLVRRRQRELHRDVMPPTAAADDVPAPLLVHCSAGCGRTGTVIAIDYVQQLLDTFSQTGTVELLKDFSVYSVALELRKQRNAMIQTPDQYVVVYKAVEELVRDALTKLDGRAHRGANTAMTPATKTAPESPATAAAATTTTSTAAASSAAGQTPLPGAGLNDMDDLITRLTQQPELAARAPGGPLQPSSSKGQVAEAVAAWASTSSASLSASCQPRQQQSGSVSRDSGDSAGKPVWPAPAVTLHKSSSAAASLPAAQQGLVAGSTAAGHPSERSSYENLGPPGGRPPRTKSVKNRVSDADGERTGAPVLSPCGTQSTGQLDGKAAGDTVPLAIDVTPPAVALTIKTGQPSLPLPPSRIADEGGRTGRSQVPGNITGSSPDAERRAQGNPGRSASPHSPGLAGNSSSSSGASGSAVRWRKGYNQAVESEDSSVSLAMWPAPATGIKMHRAHQPPSPLMQRDTAAAPVSGLQRAQTLHHRQLAPSQATSLSQQQQQSPTASTAVAPLGMQTTHPPITAAGGPGLMSVLAQQAVKASRSMAASMAAEQRPPSADAVAPKPSSGVGRPSGSDGIYMEIEPPAAAAAAAARLKPSSSLGTCAMASGDAVDEIPTAAARLTPPVSHNGSLPAGAMGAAGAQQSAWRPVQPGCRPLPALPVASDGDTQALASSQPAALSTSPASKRQQPAASEYTYVDLYSVNKWSLQHIARGGPADDSTAVSSYSVADDDGCSSGGELPPAVPPKTTGAYFIYDDADKATVLQPDSAQHEMDEAGTGLGSSHSPSPAKPKYQQAASADLANLQNKVKGFFQPTKKSSGSDPSAAPASNSILKEHVLYHGITISYPNLVGKPKGPKGMPLQWKQSAGDSVPFPRET